MIDIPHPRLELARLPTPLERLDRLTAAWGGPTIWVKRDDLTGFGLSGNKVRKLELHLAAAREAGATHVVTCGAVQSNHCRATALAAARLGFTCTLLLRSADGEAPAEATGNHLLQGLAGARFEFVTSRGYADRHTRMAAIADEQGETWVIPEGASDHLGTWAFAAAADELVDQWDALGIGTDPVVWHASSSGSTTAGLALGTGLRGRSWRIVGSSVGEPVALLGARIAAVRPTEEPWNEPELVDDYVGEGYGLATAEELAVQTRATELTGLLWDPAYTGKALAGLRRHIGAGRLSPDDHVVFWHTGGGFAAFAHDWSVAATA